MSETEREVGLVNPDREGGGEPACPIATAPRTAVRRWVRRGTIIGLLVLVGVAVWFFFLRGPQNDLERFEGDWQVAVHDRVTPMVFRVQADRWQSHSNGIDVPAYRITLNETANPKEIDLDLIDTSNIRGPKPKLHGIYAFDGDSLRVRVNDTSEPRPTTFDDPDATVWVLTRVRLEEVP